MARALKTFEDICVIKAMQQDAGIFLGLNYGVVRALFARRVYVRLD